MSFETLGLHYHNPKRSTYFIDFERVFNFPDSSAKLVALMAERINTAHLDPDLLVQPHLARINPETYHHYYYLAGRLAGVLGKQAATYYEYENGQAPMLVGGQPESNRRVLIIDGAVRTGETILRTTDYLRRLNPECVVDSALVYVVRPVGVKQDQLRRRLEENGVTLDWMLTSSKLLNDLYSNGYITREAYLQAAGDEDFIE